MYLTHDENTTIKTAIDAAVKKHSVSRRVARKAVCTAMETATFKQLVTGCMNKE